MEESQVTAGVDSSPLKSSKKVPRSSEGDSSTEGKSSTKRDGTEDVNKDTEMSEGNKSDPEEGASPENIVEQGRVLVTFLGTLSKCYGGSIVRLL